MYYFKHNEVTLCIDSTKERKSFGLGRLIYHSKIEPNIKGEKS